MNLKNSRIRNYSFLSGMYADGYFPDFLVDKIRQILLGVCRSIEELEPADEAALLAITHEATERINDLDEEFVENESELETVAREVMAENFEFIVRAYGFEEVDIEDVIATRDW